MTGYIEELNESNQDLIGENIRFDNIIEQLRLQGNNHTDQILELSNAHNVLVDRVDQIKSCNCSDKPNEPDPMIIAQTTDLFDRVGNLEQTLMQHNLNQIHFENQTQLAQSGSVSFQFFNNEDSIQQLQETMNFISSTIREQLKPDRFK